MNRQLKGIALILFSILLMLAYGQEPVFDFDFRWSAVFACIGFIGLFMTCAPHGISGSNQHEKHHGRNDEE